MRAYLARGWQAHPSYTYVVPLTDLRAQWQRVDGNLRRLIKRCTETDRLGFTDDDDFAAFFRLPPLARPPARRATYLPEAAAESSSRAPAPPVWRTCSTRGCRMGP